MQGTVASFDQTTRTGQSLADHIRHLRVGQRVFIEMSGEAVTSIRIWS